MLRKRKEVSEPLTPTAPGAPKGHWAQRPLLVAVLLISFGLILAGLLTPALHVSSFGFVGGDISILNGIEAFYADGQVFLATLVLAVSVVFPVAKIILAIMLSLSFNAAGRRGHRLASLLAELARWSMADVFILAVAVMVIDGRLISSADLLPGAYFFAGGVILSALAITYLRVSLRRHVNTVTN